MAEHLARIGRGTTRATAIPLLATTVGVASAKFPAEIQLTFGSEGRVLTNHAVWSADSEWLACDLRQNPESFTGTLIEAINVRNGDSRVPYRSRNGAACGVVTWAPDGREVVFIHGPEHPTADWSYGFSRRFGMLVDVESGRATRLDAATYAPPFVPGALRGGSHVHQFSPDGQRISFTYDDEVLLQAADAVEARAAHQRNVGIATPAGPVVVGRNHPRNGDGAWFSVLVTRTVAHPRPGSDEISRACEEGWVGVAGYRRADGIWQRHALAFQGTVVAADGREHTEVFVVDLPDDLTIAGAGPLEGTETTRPAPPLGTVQRRLTFTADRPHRGIQGPRHWLRTSPDGTQVAFLMRDDQGVAQLCVVPTAGGPVRQFTQGPSGVESAFSWTPDGRHIAHVMDGSVFLTEVATGQGHRLTRPRPPGEEPLALACVVSPDGRRIAFQRQVDDLEGKKVAHIFVVNIPPRLR